MDIVLPENNAPGYSFSKPSSNEPQQRHGFYPYTDNGGSILGIAGEDFVILAGDTRSTSGYNINTRYAPKVFEIGNGMVMAVVGYAADGEALVKRIQQRIKTYNYHHGKPMSVVACARMISTTLYNKRFFPYYTHVILGGIDSSDGTGALFSYDPVGSYEREQCRAGGAAASLIMPFLDNQVNFKNQYIPGSGTGLNKEERPKVKLSREQALKLVKDSFTSAVERHIEVGDGLITMVVGRAADGKDATVERIEAELKKD